MTDASQSSQLADRSRPKHPVRLERAHGVATILIENPPVNALSAAVRQGIFVALDAAEADPNTIAIIIAATGRTFPAGADITEFGQPPQDPSLPVLCDRVEACGKPVFAALHGTVLGGGLELAMAAHYRIAAPSTQLGLPEVKLGILPGAGGTQRAPRLIGVEQALTLIQSGISVTAADAQAKGLIDAVDDDPRAAALALAEAGMELRPTSKDRSRLRTAPADLELLAAARQALPSMRGPRPAMDRIIDCLEAAILLPFDIGMTRERDAFEECVTSGDSLALRHLFLAERKAAKFPELQGIKAPVPAHIAVVGGGLAGAGLAVACLNAGLPVTVVEDGEAGVTDALDRIGEAVQSDVADGRMSEAQGAQALTRLTLTARLPEISAADIVVHAGPDDPALQPQMMEQIGRHAKPDAVITTCAGFVDMELLATSTRRPGHVAGLTIPAPVQFTRLAEIGVLPDTDRATVARVHRFARGLGKVPVRAKAAPGHILARMQIAYRRVADAMLEDGALPAQIDAAMQNFGFRQGPYEELDRIGLDTARAMRKARGVVPGERMVSIGDKMCELGWLGRKTGQGYYLYEGDSPAVPNPDAVFLIEELRTARKIIRRDFTDQDISDRLFLALLNEGAKLVDEGIASRPSDIDVAMVYGLGYPPERGGPLFEADQETAFEVHRRLAVLADQEPMLWQVSDLIARLARERGKFSDLN